MSLSKINDKAILLSEAEAHQSMVFAQSGDQSHYQKLLISVESMARGYLSKRLQNPSDLEDLTQEILISVHNARHTFDLEKPIFPWLYAIFNYRFQDYLRAYYRARRNITQDISNSDERGLATDPQLEWEYRNFSQKLLSYLVPQQRRIIEMLYVNGNSAEEVSALLNISVSNVRTTAHRAIKRIRSKVNIPYE
ncbi:MAG: sigma-70 family RNA polymerase sigma factor [Porticoccaceae bacterium]|nr:sigma-70 family RNA polymerase sigma factor [Porticoccaceae bacterium]